nr:glycerol-3-phosphate dehydrogenase/oxidase [Microbacterium immunditiarum]
MRRERWDVVVVGGGATGCGVALDAAARGLRVALIERHDLAEGTSSRSSKLLHGGLRYLEQLEFGLVREALRERRLLVRRLAPHLVRVTGFLLPFTKWWERPYLGAGVALYDVMSGLRPGVPRHRHLSRRSLRAAAPDLAPARLRGGLRYSDVQVDDARLVVELARTAAREGAAVLTRVELEDADRTADGYRLQVRDDETGERFEVSAAAVVNAAGVASPEVDLRLGAPEPVCVRASKGVHLVLPRQTISSENAWIVRTRRSVLFLLPWDDHWIVGTTDTPFDGEPTHPRATEGDIRELLAELNALLPVPIDPTDLVSVYAGLRPLVADPRKTDTAAVSRRHLLWQPQPGHVTIVGGKLTTYRTMARDAVDAVVRELQRSVRRCPTTRLPLVGATWGAPTDAWERRYGACADEVRSIVLDEPGLGADLPGATGWSGAEVVHAVRFEGARRLDDVLVRRTRITMTAPDGGRAAADAVADLMAVELGWSNERRTAEIASFLKTLDAEDEALVRLGSRRARVERR